ncbi:hypothetical protein GCM10027589_06500 [Actinocorallia lasiicapitis]
MTTPGPTAHVPGKADARLVLARLRAEFADVGFVADPPAGHWFAVGPHGLFLSATSPGELRARVLAAMAQRRAG